MTVPLVVLGVLSAIGGFLNDPAWLPIVRADVLDRWLDPVTGAASQRLAGSGAAAGDPRVAEMLAGVAAVVAVVGVLVAVLRLKPAALKPAREPQPAERGIERVIANKYYVDEIYDQAIVEPLVVVSRNVLWRGVDGLIDGTVNLSAAVWRWLGSAGSALQNGEVGTYAWALIAGVVAVLSAVALRS